MADEVTRPPQTAGSTEGLSADEQRLHEMGYKQELSRAWSGFTNFAISFTIISVLAGMLHDVRLRLAERRPDRGLDRLAGALPLRPHGGLLDGRADLRAIPTAGGPYWWAHELGGKGWSWMTGWFNIVGLIGIVASVAYGARSSSTSCSASTG